jgi:hypothetical protein
VGADDVSDREEDILLVDPNSQACSEGKGNYRDLGFRLLFRSTVLVVIVHL